VILATATSKNHVLIRLTDERWEHITLSHIEIDPYDSSKVLQTIEHPDVILKGDVGELLAVRKMTGKKSWIVVAYKEVTRQDGFILTAYITTDAKWLFKREIIWNKA
jgi:hypothetical protein